MKDLKTILTGVLMVMMPVLSQAQGTIVSNADGVSYTAYDAIPDSVLLEIYGREFTNLITGISASSFGTFASVDSKNPGGKVALSHIFQGGNIASVTVEGAVTDGYLQALKNSELNTNVAVQGDFNFLLGGSGLSSLKLDLDDARKLTQARRKAQSTFEKEMKKLDTIAMNAQIAAAQQKNEELKQKMAKTTDELELAQITEEYLDNMDKIKTLKASIKAVKLKGDAWVTDQIYGSLKKRNSANRKNRPVNTATLGFRIPWVSVGFRASHDAFKRYDPVQPFNDQVTDETYWSYQLNLAGHLYQWSAIGGPTYYLVGRATFNYKNNLDQLGKVTLEERSGTNDSSGFRQTVKEFSAYTGNYKDDLLEVTLGVDAYYFLSAKNNLGLHFYPGMKVTEVARPVYSIGAGVLLPVRKKDDPASIFNIEIYLNYPDLSDASFSNSQWLNQNNGGFRLTFPIKFKPKSS